MRTPATNGLNHRRRTGRGHHWRIVAVTAGGTGKSKTDFALN